MTTEELLAEYGLRRFFVVPHTHWDREWYSPFEHFRLRLGRVVDEVIEVLERDSRFASFTLDGQSIVLEDYCDVRPQNEDRLRALLTAGRVEVGPSYVLPDELLVGAEPLVRNLLMGRQVCERFGTRPTPVGYLPDSFGHPLQLPQILAGFGIDSFIFSRGLGDELDEVGVVFRWCAPDGSEVRAFQQLPDYSNFAAVGGADDGISRIAGIAQQFGPALAAAGVEDVLLCNGTDHLPIQAGLPALCDELQTRLPATSFTIASYRDYIRAVAPSELPGYTGELLGSRLQNILRGVNSTRLYLKRANDQAERRLLSAETLAALVALSTGLPFPGSDLKLAWRELLRCQPHDSICGCSCDEVHRDMLVRYESLHRTLDVIEARALEAVAARDAGGRVGVFNPLPHRRCALVELPGKEPVTVDLDGFAARAVEIREIAELQPREGRTIESDRFRVEAAPDGSLTVLDKGSGRRFEQLHRLEDEPDRGDLYNFCPVEDAPKWHGEGASVRVLRDGPIVSELELSIEAERPAGLEVQGTVPMHVVTVVRLVHGSGRIEFRTTVENRGRDHRLRVAFPGGRADSWVRAEGNFALVRRPLVPAAPRTEWAEPPDATQHTLGAVAVGALALLSKGLPEYEASSAGELWLTLLRSVGIISRPGGALSTRPRGAGPPVETPEGQCLGSYELEYALLTDADSMDDLSLLRESQDYRYGLLVNPAAAELDPPLAVEGDVVFSCLKGAEDGDGLILRCFNPGPSPAGVRVAGDVSAWLTQMDETGERPADGGAVTLGPFEVGTVRLRRR